MNMRQVSVCILMASFIPLVSCWGPYTHQLMGCSLVTEGPAGKDCLQSNVTSAFVMGNSSPDAVKSLGLHSYEFAGALYLYAISQLDTEWQYSERTSSLSDTYHFASASVAFAAGFGAHMAEDTVGHHDNGYLTPEYDHPLEFAVDTYEVKNFTGHFQFQNLADNTWAMQLIADASTSAFFNNSAAEVTFDQVQESAEDFKDTTDLESLAIPFNVLYEEEMVRWDNYGATNWTEAESHYYHSKKWCLYTAVAWLGAMAETMDPTVAENAATETADYLFSHYFPFY